MKNNVHVKNIVLKFEPKFLAILSLQFFSACKNRLNYINVYTFIRKNIIRVK